MNDKTIGSWLSSGLAFVFTTIQPDVLLQYVSLALTIISVIVSLAFSVWHWYREAKKDGSITHDEIEEGFKIMKDGIEEMKDSIEKGKDGKQNHDR